MKNIYQTGWKDNQVKSPLQELKDLVYGTPEDMLSDHDCKSGCECGGQDDEMTPEEEYEEEFGPMGADR